MQAHSRVPALLHPAWMPDRGRVITRLENPEKAPTTASFFPIASIRYCKEVTQDEWTVPQGKGAPVYRSLCADPGRNGCRHCRGKGNRIGSYPITIKFAFQIFLKNINFFLKSFLDRPIIDSGSLNSYCRFKFTV